MGKPFAELSVDTENLKKGDVIPFEAIEVWADCKRDHRDFQFAVLQMGALIEKHFHTKYAVQVTVRNDAKAGGIRICTDTEAVLVNHTRTRAKVRGLRRDLRRMEGVDSSQLADQNARDDYSRRRTQMTMINQSVKEALRRSRVTATPPREDDGAKASQASKRPKTEAKPPAAHKPTRPGPGR